MDEDRGRPRGGKWVLLAAIGAGLGLANWLAVSAEPFVAAWIRGPVALSYRANQPPPDLWLFVPWIGLVGTAVGLLLGALVVLLYLARRPRPLPWLVLIVLGANLLPAWLPTRWTGVLRASLIGCTELPCSTAGLGPRVGPHVELDTIQIVIDQPAGRAVVRLQPDRANRGYPWCSRMPGVTLSVAGAVLEQTSAGGTSELGRGCDAPEWEGALPVPEDTRAGPIRLRTWWTERVWGGLEVPGAWELEPTHRVQLRPRASIELHSVRGTKIGISPDTHSGLTPDGVRIVPATLALYHVKEHRRITLRLPDSLDGLDLSRVVLPRIRIHEDIVLMSDNRVIRARPRFYLQPQFVRLGE